MSAEWLVIRGSGVAAFCLLSAATIWGLLVSSKVVGRFVKAKPLTWFHESLGVGALIATAIHVAVVSVHDHLDFTWGEILVPGRSDWRTLPTSLGVVALYGSLLVVGSFYVKKRIGQRMWRVIHYGAFGTFLASLLHGITAGTDTWAPLMLGLYLGTATVVGALIAMKLTAAGRSQRPAPTDRPATRPQ